MVKTKCPNCYGKLKNNITEGMVVSSHFLFLGGDNRAIYIIDQNKLFEKITKNEKFIRSDFIFFSGIPCWLCMNCGMFISFDMDDVLLQKWCGKKCVGK